MGVLETLPSEHRTIIDRYVERQTFAPGTTILREGERARDMFFVVDGEGQLRRGDLELRGVRPGDHVGELGLLAGTVRAATLVATTPLTVARLDERAWNALSDREPRTAIALVQALVAALGTRLTEMTDNVGALLRERSIPRRVEVDVELSGEQRVVRTGTPVGELLPEAIDSSPVVAALVDRKMVPLTAPITAPARVEPLTRAHWEGERIIRESSILLLLEAAARIDGLRVRIGSSMGSSTFIELGGCADPASAVERLQQGINELIARDVPFREEWWTVEEARSHFAEQGWTHAVELLETHREPTVVLVSCGRVYALRVGATVARASMLRDVRLVRRDDGAVLLTGDAPRELDARSAWAESMREHARFLATRGATSVGAFNRSCIDGQVSETIRVAEGFHEKRLGKIADAIAAREGRIRVVCIAGPSSSGKTTFIKRLRVQLQIVGIDPVGLSLDDYYVDREKTVRGPDGEYDYEALEALDLALLRDHLARLLHGEQVRTARYDFLTGKSAPAGGAPITLGPQQVLMIEGIHGLNPALLGNTIPSAQVFRVFIQPMTSLPIDAASRVSPSDLRLIRRIVRDRRARGSTPGDNILRWPSVRRGERAHIFPFVEQADVVFDTSLVYELSVLKTYAERYLLEVPSTHPAHPTATRLRKLVDQFVAIHAAHVPPTSILREFIGESAFEY